MRIVPTAVKCVCYLSACKLGLLTFLLHGKPCNCCGELCRLCSISIFLSLAAVVRVFVYISTVSTACTFISLEALLYTYICTCIIL